MSANPRSPESGDVPEAIQKRIDLVRGLYADLFPNYTPTEYEEARLVLNVDAVAIHWLDDERSRLTAALSTVQERAERAERDAARYRYVRDAITLTTRMPMLINGHKCSALLVTGEQYDAAIDAAIESSTPIPDGADRAE